MIIESGCVCAVRQMSAQPTNYCGRCYAEKEFITVAEAARFIKTSIETILKLAEAEMVHLCFAPSGEVCVYMASLLIFEGNRFH